MLTLTRGARRPGGRVALATLLTALWLTLLTLPASAHDALVDSDPAEGATLTTVPTELVLTFSGDISDLGVQFVVNGPDGRDVVQGTPTVEGTIVTQALAEELVDGDYEAAWRVTSSDGHPISGTIPFTIDAGQAPPSEATSADPTTDANSPTSEAATSEAATSEAPTTSAAPTEPATDNQAASEGIPTWGWLVAALAAVGLVACGFLAFRRR